MKFLTKLCFNICSLNSWIRPKLAKYVYTTENELIFDRKFIKKKISFSSFIIKTFHI